MSHKYSLSIKDGSPNGMNFSQTFREKYSVSLTSKQITETSYSARQQRKKKPKQFWTFPFFLKNKVKKANRLAQIHSLIQGRTFAAIIRSFVELSGPLNKDYLPIYNTPEGSMCTTKILANLKSKQMLLVNRVILCFRYFDNIRSRLRRYTKKCEWLVPSVYTRTWGRCTRLWCGISQGNWCNIFSMQSSTLFNISVSIIFRL